MSLLTKEEQVFCSRLSSTNNEFSTRAAALMAIDSGATQANAASSVGLSVGQVKYWVSKFRRLRLGAFPEGTSVKAAPATSKPKSKKSKKSSGKKSSKKKSGTKKASKKSSKKATKKSSGKDSKRKAKKVTKKAGRKSTKRSKKKGKK